MRSKQPSTILVIGELNMDLILDNVGSFPELEKEKIAGDMNLTMGSSSAIFAGNIARLGVDTRFCGMIGDDSFGSQIIEGLQAFGIDTSPIVVDKKRKTGLTAIIRHNDSRAMVTYPGTMTHFSLADIPDEVFGDAQHLHISSIFLQPGIKRDLFDIIKRANAQDMTISIDPQWDPDEQWDLDLPRLLDQIDFFLPNEQEFLHLTKTHSVKEALLKLGEKAQNSVIVKQGTKGATYLDSTGQTNTLPAYINQQPVDAIGAGDSFDAGFIYQFLQNKSIKNCIQFGNLTGAVSTTEAGGTQAITSLNHVIKIAKNNLSIDPDEITR